jgi:hypothetical protein
LHLTERTGQPALQPREHDDENALAATGHRGSDHAEQQHPRHDGGDQQPLTPHTVGPAGDSRHEERARQRLEQSKYCDKSGAARTVRVHRRSRECRQVAGVGQAPCRQK